MEQLVRRVLALPRRPALVLLQVRLVGWAVRVLVLLFGGGGAYGGALGFRFGVLRTVVMVGATEQYRVDRNVFIKAWRVPSEGVSKPFQN